jgi:glycosyltransferase involved in cell wall biosynthesis
MIENGIPSQKLRYIPNGVAYQNFVPTYEGRYLLYVGRLSREKGIKTLMEASAGSTMALRIVGDGPEKEPLQQWVKDCCADHISFLGYQSGDQLRDSIRGAAIVVVPSECYENASMVILEAMACGKPVIASRTGGIPEQVDDGRTGLLFESGDVEGLRQAIQTLVLDPERRRFMGYAARQRVEEHFSLDHHCTRLTALYQEAIGA